MEFKFEDEGSYWAPLPAAFGGATLRIDLQEARGQTPDWALVAAFSEFLLAKGAGLTARVQGPLRFLAEQTGWFAPDELAAAVFEWQEAALLYGMSRLALATGPRWAFELHCTLDVSGQPWADTYGDWVATFQGETLVGLRRDQV